MQFTTRDLIWLTALIAVSVLQGDYYIRSRQSLAACEEEVRKARAQDVYAIRRHDALWIMLGRHVEMIRLLQGRVRDLMVERETENAK